ncbi:MAG TPA: alpha/beta hydrolase [Spirochaetia bacterium]|nr:alpha/beta hydrolase [Spirochaetia bacterium]
MKAVGLLCVLIAAANFAAAEGAESKEIDSLVSRSTVVAGVEVHYRETATSGGSGASPMLLVHGWLGSSYDFVPLMERLTPGVRAIAVDLPGCGRSQKTGIQFTPAYFVDFLADFIRTLKLGPIILVGHSMGGAIAVNFAVRNPNLVEKLVLIDPDGLPGEEGALGRLREMGFVVDLGLALNNRLAVEFTTRLNVFHNPDLVTREFIDSIAETCLSPAGRQAQSAITKEVLGRYPVEELLPRLDLPTLILWGDDDRVLRPNWAREFARRISGSRLSIVANSGHMPQFENPAAVAEQISEFAAHGGT